LVVKDVTFTKAARNTLMRMPRNEADRIRSKVQQYAENPPSLANNVTAMKGEPFVRLRVGDWRVIMNDRGAVLDVLKIGPRGSVYD
jgi:mRNA interferase RelE/StbE